MRASTISTYYIVTSRRRRLFTFSDNGGQFCSVVGKFSQLVLLNCLIVRLCVVRRASCVVRHGGSDKLVPSVHLCNPATNGKEAKPMAFKKAREANSLMHLKKKHLKHLTRAHGHTTTTASG